MHMFIKKELQARKENTFRKLHETQWKEVDRQVQMEPMKKYGKNGKELPPSWQSAFELGELSKASEVTTAAVMRLIFPFNRTFFEAHCKPPMTVNEQGKSVPQVTPEQQKMADGIRDPKTGQCTAISSALDVAAVPGFVIDTPPAKDTRS